MWLLAGECRPLLLYNGHPQIPSICHCNYLIICFLLDQDLLLSKKTKLAIIVTCIPEKTHPALLWVYGKHSERVFSTKEAQAIHISLLFMESTVKLVNGV